MWENPQGFQSNYRECSLAQCSVLPILLLFPTEGSSSKRGQEGWVMQHPSWQSQCRAVCGPTALHSWPRVPGLSASSSGARSAAVSYRKAGTQAQGKCAVLASFMSLEHWLS